MLKTLLLFAIAPAVGAFVTLSDSVSTSNRSLRLSKLSSIESDATTTHRNDECSRRSIVRDALLSTIAVSLVGRPSRASAVYGADAKIEIPDVIQGMSDRTNKQCLVESLGNRECLVYLDPDNQLYKGSEVPLLLERLNGSMNALQDIPTYIETKQWNKVIGVMTGPMGNLSLTMNELVKAKDDNDISKAKCKSLSIEIRNDLYAISGAADRKQVKDAMVSFQRAEEKLNKFAVLINGK